MRALLAILVALPLCAQEAAQPKPEEKKEAATAAPQEQAPAAAASQDQTAAPAPAVDENISVVLDLGNRWVDFRGGDYNTYRSVINLRGGLRLFGGEVRVKDPKRRLFDRLDVRAANWGGDPYNSLHIGARKTGVYDLTSNYRNVIYFNFLPSFANPFQDQGILLNQRSYDIHRRFADIHLDFRPGKRVVPYLAYDRNSNEGTGITTFVATSNEYPVSNRIRDRLDTWRGGVRLEMSRWHVTLEQGGTKLRDDQEVFTDVLSTGNRQTPLLGQTLFLTDALQAYGVRGNNIYSKALFTSNPFTWMNLFGQFLYSRPENDVRFTQNNAGQFVQLSPLLFFTAQQDIFSGLARMPRSSGSAGTELRPLRRLRILQGWMTDRLHTSTSGVLNSQLFPAGTAPVTLAPLAAAERLVMNFSQHQIDAFYDLTRHITLRGGHRYVWGDSVVPPSNLTPAGERGELSRQVGIAGALFRIGSKLSANFEFEGAASDRTYFRTSLHDYQSMRARARYQLLPSLGFSANFTYLNNENPTPGINYEFLSRYNTFSVYWTPGGGQRVSVLGEYARSSLRSDIFYLAPQDLTPERSLYRDNAHTANALAELPLPVYKRGDLTPKVSFGGSLFRSSGSRPTRFWQPMGRVSLPLHRNVAVVSEWRWYGFAQPFYRFEEFRTHLFTAGLRITR